MKQIPKRNLTKKIHFPKIEPVYEELIKQNISKRIWKFITKRRKFKITTDYICWCSHINKFIFIPKKFIYDGASVPKILNFIYTTIGILFYGAGPHDFGYKYNGLLLVNEKTLELYFQQFSRLDLDSIFKQLCIEESNMPKAISFATLVVRLTGKNIFKQHHKNNNLCNNDFPTVYK